MINLKIDSFYKDQSNSPPISIPYSSSAGGAYFCFYYCLGAFLSSILAAVWTGAFDWEDPVDTPTDPKKSLTFFPLRALTTAFTNPADTATPEAWITAFNEAWLT